ncbi:MAG: glycosyltransferase [Propionibacteriaceae bacterium]
MSFGSEGDLRPLLSLAGGLKAAGHSVAVVAEESGAVLASAAGVEFVGLVGDLGGVLGASLRQAFTRFRWPDQEWLETIAAAATGSDVVVGLPAASYHAAAAADQVGAMGILAGLQPMLPTADFVPSVLGKPRVPARFNHAIGRFVDRLGWSQIGTRVNSARRDLGLASMTNPFDSLPILGAWSPTLVPAPADWDSSRVTVTGQWHAAGAGWTPTPELEAFLAAEERPIYVGFGSLKGPKVAYAIESVLRAFAGTYRIVLQAHPSITTELPGSVLRVGAVPHDWLFRRCGALVHHCGAGTAHAAARSGIPSVPVPFTLDQPFWADRLRALGVASRPVDPRSGWEGYEAPLRETVAAREPAASLAVRLAAEDGVAVAVAEIERLAATRA